MSKYTVLIIEDNHEQATLLAQSLDMLECYTPIQAHSGEEALVIVKKHHYKIDCILLDVYMEDMSGLDFLKILRKIEQQHSFNVFIPVVMVTAYESPSIVEAAMDPVFGKATGFLGKPYNMEAIKGFLEQVVLAKKT